MTDFFDQLVQRSLENSPAGFQPRLLSRYEETQPGNQDDAPVESTPSPPAMPMTPAPDPQGNSIPPVSARWPGPTESVIHEHHHHHHEPTIIERQSLSLAPRDEFRVVHTRDGNGSAPNRQQSPNVAPCFARSEERLPPPTREMLAGEKLSRPPGPMSPPLLSAERPEPVRADSPAEQPRLPPVYRQRAEFPSPPTAPIAQIPAAILPPFHSAKAPPQVIAEPVRSSERETHTVTVTIGRIEVHGPQPKSAPTGKPPRPAPRVMTLDDYARRRAGGAG